MTRAEPHVDDRDLEAVVSQLRVLIDPTLRIVDGPRRVGGGFDNAIVVVQLDGRELAPEWRERLVLRIARDNEKVAWFRREAALHEFLIDGGFCVPRVLAVLPAEGGVTRPVQVLQWLDGPTALNVMLRPWATRRTVRTLAELLASLHELPIPELEGPTAVELRLEAPRRFAAQAADTQMQALIADAVARVDRLPTDRRVVCHGDFHPGNVLLGRRPCTLDWTDAGVGDRHLDVARFVELLAVAAAGAPHPAARALIAAITPRMRQTFISAYESAARVVLDVERIAAYEVVHLVHDLAIARQSDEGALATALEKRIASLADSS